MVHQVEAAVIYFLRGLFPNAKRYRNEFSSGGEWIPSFPAVMVRVESLVPEQVYGNGEVCSYEGSIIVYIGGKLNSPEESEEFIPTVIERVVNAVINANGLGFTDVTGQARYIGLEFREVRYVESEYGVEIYAVSINYSIT